MGLFPSNFHSDAAKIRVAVWALAWIARADLGKFRGGQLGFLCLKSPVQFSSSSCTLEGGRIRSHQGEGYDELADAIARVTGMGLMQGMEDMPFASLLPDSSALAWAWFTRMAP
eukprot:9487074-Pyramimonas_sp.AAC.1